MRGRLRYLNPLRAAAVPLAATAALIAAAAVTGVGALAIPAGVALLLFGWRIAYGKDGLGARYGRWQRSWSLSPRPPEWFHRQFAGGVLAAVGCAAIWLGSRHLV